MDPNFKASKAFQKKFQNSIYFSAKNIKSQIILSAGDFNRFIELQSHQQLIDLSEKYGKNNCLCESRQNSKLVNLFFDYDCKDQLQSLSDTRDTLNALKANIQNFLPQLKIQFYVKHSVEQPPSSPRSFDPSGSDTDSVSTVPQEFVNSMHIICHLSTSDGHNIYFDYSNGGCSQVKFFVSKLNLQPPFDHKQAYSGHLLRLLYSNKFDKQGNLTDRIFQCSPYSNFTDPLKSLSSFCPTEKYMLLTDYVNKNFILQYVKNQEYAKNYLLKDIIQRPNESHLSLTLTEQHTPVCEHKSNNAVCMFYNDSSNPNIIIKCQDAECGKFFQTFFHYDDNLHRCQIFTTGDNSSDKQLSNQISSSDIRSHRDSSSGSNTPNSGTITPSSNQKNNNINKDKKLVQAIILHICQETNQDSGYVVDNIEFIEQNGYSGEASPPSNQLFRGIVGNQKCSFVGRGNYHYYTINGVEYKIKFSKELTKKLKQPTRRFERQELLEMGVVFNQYNYINVNNITNNFNNKEDKDDTVYDDGFEDIQFDSEKHKECFISIINDDFQFITELYNVQYPDQFLYVYDENDKGTPMFFDNLDDSRKVQTNGGYWSTQGGLQVAKKRIRNYAVQFFNGILKQFSNPKDMRRKLVQIKLRSVRGVIKNNNELDQYLMETYFNKKVKFNNYPNYLHFQNGTFDLIQRKFVKTTPEMYNTFQIDYDYDSSVSYEDLYQQLSQIMPVDEFEWFLKQLSNCLNPQKVIEEKQVVILCGKGNNGKSVVFNLMNETLCLDAYSVNSRSIMIQAPNTSSSNPTPDTAKLLYKRFCHIAELDKAQSFNQQQIKILTGGDKIQARDLFKSFITFQPYCGFFISCNQISYIDTSDGGFMNRLKIIDLKYQFEQNPTNKFQKPVNKQLQHLIQTTQWKQGFMNLLIHKYYQNSIQLPDQIKKTIQQHINIAKNPIHIWLDNSIQYKQGSLLFCEDIRQLFLDENDSKIGKQKFTRILKEFFDDSPHIYTDVYIDYVRIRTDTERRQENGVCNISFVQEDELQYKTYKINFIQKNDQKNQK